MPVCPACDNRPFINKEALLQHLKTSSAAHPVCVFCDRRFVSDTAYDAHMADKHPPTYDCTICNKPFRAPFALEDHYRGSAVHPNCVRCGRGFKDDAACEEHHRVVHPKIPCIACGGVLFYEDAMELHYLESDNHPSCSHCHKGFKNSVAYAEHFSSSHEELQCTMCSEIFETSQEVQNHFWTSLNHSKCYECAVGFKDTESKKSHQESIHKKSPVVEKMELHDPPGKNQIDEVQQLSPASFEQPKIDSSVYGPAFSVSPPKGLQTLITEERRIDSPDLHIRTDFVSPLTEVKPPLFSPVSLPRPADNIERFWNSREVRSPRIQNTTIPDSLNRSPLYHNNDPGPSTSRNSIAVYEAVQPASRSREGAPNYSHVQNSALQLSPPRSDLRTRLYPGSVRHAMRTASLTKLSLSAEQPFSGEARKHFSDARSSRSNGGEGRSFNPTPRQNWGIASSDHLINWKDLMDSSNQLFKSNTPRASLFLETMLPTADTSHSLSPPNFDLQGQNLIPSPSLATISSPASSPARYSFVSGHNELDTRPTTASSTRLPDLPNPTYTITASSECASPQSPEVSSPPGLGILPVISPLASTPLDLITFDIPEAQKPLPDSPVETAAASPVTVIAELDPQEQLAVPPALSPLSTGTSSAKSFVTSPQEPSGNSLASVGMQTTEVSLANPTVQSPVDPVKETARNPLHCRACLADTCDDITASMCGHIFCNRCIVDAVIKTNRCPVCMTPTLLYCLFRLDLAA